MARTTKRTPKNNPQQVRLNEVEKDFNQAHAKTGVAKADMIRLAVRHFLDAHRTPESIIEANIKYRCALRAAS